MRTIEVKILQFEELNDAAKEKAREWWRKLEAQDFGSQDELFEAAVTAGALLGITFGERSVPLMGGGTRTEPDIRYSGFSSQGDGASFVGTYEHRAGGAIEIRAEFGGDSASTLELYRIADGLEELQRKYDYKLAATITQSGRYVHDMTMDLDITEPETDDIYSEEADTYKPLLELMRRFARWIYSGLEEDYNSRMEDEYVDDAITANEYEFYEDGSKA